MKYWKNGVITERPEVRYVINPSREQILSAGWKPYIYVWKWITNGFSYRKIDWEVEAKLNEKDLTYIERTYPEIWEHIKHNFKTNDSNTK